MKRPTRALLAGGVLVVLAIPVAGGVAAGALLQSQAVRARLARAVQRTTGYATNLADAGTVTVGGLWTLHPTIALRGVAVLNPPGFSRADLATVRRLSATVALWPLLSRRIELPEVTLDGVDVLLERADGHGNWEPAPAMARPRPAADTGASAGPNAWTVRAGHVRVTDASVAWKGAPAVRVAELDARPDLGTVTGKLAVGGMPFAMNGSLGENAKGPVEVGLSGEGVTVRLDGGAGAPFAAHVAVAELEALAPLAGRKLPPLRQVALQVQAGPGGTLSVTARAGRSDLGQGLRLDHAELSAPAPGEPVQVTAEGALHGLPLSIALNVGRASALFGGPVPFQALVLADGGTASAQGSVANLSGAGPEFTVQARIPDLRRTGALAGVALPALTSLAADARIAPAPNGSGALIRGLRVTSAQGDLGGDALLRWSPRPLLRGSLVAQSLDLDAILAPPASASAAPPAALPAAPAPAPAPSQPRASARPLPFAALREADMDVRLAAGGVTWHGGLYRALQARILLQDGRLRLDPLRALTAGGSLDARVAADAASVPPTLAVTLLAPGLDAALLAAALGVPGSATGTVDLDVDLRGAGADWRAIAPTLDGHAGVALVNGDVENQVLLALFGPALRAANLPADGAGRSKVRCFALRFDAVAGHVDVKALALDASRVRLDGEGTLNLVDSTLDLHLRPTLRIGSTGVAIPVHLAGPLGAPVPALERGAISPGRIGLSILGGGAAQPDPCGPALVAARGNRPGVAPQ